ncbi:bifunctional phosphoribosylaminoimidazolecarboxamide formyltransferase/IMP cyclohydrolase [candidate division KSB1 bacterium]|nr:bifunctional phosphoribosylaminoimidazolecarboxamide formyltransferase/IMP cyclohydrolase [candidate division KSB1 bacterium]
MSLIQRALLSVHDKSGLLELASVLAAKNVEIIATGGTTRYLREHGFNVTPIDTLTGFPEILGGRVKTLHPKIFGGLLARRELDSDLQEAQAHGIGLIDLVVVNLYPFREVVTRPEVALADALENIDIGGVSLIRAAAKNFTHVAVLTHTSQYQSVIAELEREEGRLTLATRRQLAGTAFAYTSRYDAAINNYLLAEQNDGEHAPRHSALEGEIMVVALEKVQSLRYGENPHQRAGFYRDSLSRETGLAGARQLQGKELSFNNIADADAALNIVRMFETPSCVIIKHANPCGVGVGENLLEAYLRAKATDPLSAFGGIVGCNREVEGETAAAIAELFTEVVLAPKYSAEALKIFAQKKNVRVLELSELRLAPHASLELKKVAGGMLVQERDSGTDDEQSFKCVTQRAASAKEMQALCFGWKVVRWVKSNAIVFCNEQQTLGIGAGQMSRVDAVKLAIAKAGSLKLSLEGAVMASDAFFPFADGLEAAAAAGITAVIQPGGSLRDADVIAAANRLNVAMLFTGVRHFRH